jgi:hypothetical protein
VLTKIYAHRRQMHGTSSILAWFGCQECERLEALYAESINWRMEHPLPWPAELAELEVVGG